MTIWEILLIAVGLSMDAFAVSLAAGTNVNARGLRPTLRLSFHLGLFQFLMPIVGWFAGVTVESLIQSWDHWIAFGLLSLVGVRMIHGGWTGEGETEAGDPTRSLALVFLSIATSLDALAIGLSLAILRVSIWYPSVVIGAVTGALSLVGIRLGNRLGNRFGKQTEIAGGVILCLIGLHLLVSHLPPGHRP
jgi:manganese efflux pump family protein